MITAQLPHDATSYATAATIQTGLADKRSAIDCCRLATDLSFASDLFRAACELRDRHLGDQPFLIAEIQAVAPCKMRPTCNHCAHPPRQATSANEVIAAAHALAVLGYRRLRLSGGARLPIEGAPTGGHDSQIIRHVLAIRKAVDIEIEVNVGPSLTRDGIRVLKQLGVCAVTCSLETLNLDVFERCKPGDNLAARIRLLEICEREGMPIRSTIRLGIGESEEDRIDHLFFLRRFSMLRHIDLLRNRLLPGTGEAHYGPWPMAKLTAISRLLFPTLDIGLADLNPEDIALWRLAGGGNTTVSATTSPVRRQSGADEAIRTPLIGGRTVVCDHSHAISRQFNDIGLTPTFRHRYR